MKTLTEPVHNMVAHQRPKSLQKDQKVPSQARLMHALSAFGTQTLLKLLAIKAS